jgi:hypothetical protein
MSERYVCLRRQQIGGVTREPGYVFERKPYMRNLIAWVHTGYIRKLDLMDDATPAAKQEIPPDLDKLKKAELIDVIDGLGFSIEDIVGTGSGGLQTKADLIQFIKSKV